MPSQQDIRHCSVSMEKIIHLQVTPSFCPLPPPSLAHHFQESPVGSLSCPARPWHPPDSFPDLPPKQLALPNIDVHASPLASGAEQPRLSLEIKENLLGILMCAITTASICSSVSTETCLWVNLESRFTMPKPPVQKREKCNLNKLFTVVTNV